MADLTTHSQAVFNPLDMYDYSGYGKTDLVEIQPNDIRFTITKLNTSMTLKFKIVNISSDSIRVDVLPPSSSLFKITYQKKVSTHFISFLIVSVLILTILYLHLIFRKNLQRGYGWQLRLHSFLQNLSIIQTASGSELLHSFAFSSRKLILFIIICFLFFRELLFPYMPTQCFPVHWYPNASTLVLFPLVNRLPYLRLYPFNSFL